MPVAAFCRENAERAIFVNAEIDQALLNLLTPQILALRRKSADPITVYIDSRGGSTAVAETLIDLLNAPDADGNVCDVVTVVTSYAASASADFLATGDYAIAYPNAIIHFHGTREGRKEALTMESAALAARFLRESNDSHAMQLAEDTVGNSMFIYLSLRDTFGDLRKEDSSISDVECFARALYQRLSPGARAIPRRAFRRYTAIQSLANYVFSKVEPKSGERLAKTERAIIRAIIDYEYRATKKDPLWSFTEANVERIGEDFRLITDFYIGSHTTLLEPLTRRFGPYFLAETEAEILRKNEFESPEARDEWLSEQAAPQMQPLWYFIVSICRLLQEKENPLTAEDAYWLGIVNEVYGFGLPTIREIFERGPAGATSPEGDSPSESPPSGEQ
jgi:ATP-dependent protease ClpP protease subunit